MKILTSGQTSTVGGKAYHLLELKKAAFPLPNFQILSFDWFQEKETQHYLQEKNQQLTDRNTESLGVELQNFAKKGLKNELSPSILDAFSSDKSYAVRSSATVEDGQVHSFAGRFETYLNVEREALLEAIENCLLSLYTPSALHYFREKKVALQDAHMVVIIQEMVPSSLSGIYFTASPLGALNEHQIVFGKGLGDAVVEDRIPTTMVTYNPQEDLTYIQKTLNSPDIPDQLIKTLTQQAQRLMQTFGPYLDIEFGFVGDQLSILQVRPITTIQKDRLILLDNSNIVESYPGTSTPLTISFVKDAYSSIFRSLAKRLLGSNDKIMAAYEPIFQDMVSPINSHLYYEIQNWYQLLHLLPFSKQIIPIWQDMLGLNDLSVPKSIKKLRFGDKIAISWRILKAFHSSPKAMKKLETQFQTVEKYFQENYNPADSIAQQEGMYKTLHTSILSNWDLTLINDLYAFVYVGLLKKIIGPQAIQSEIAGIEAIESMKPALALEKIRENLKVDPDTQAEFQALIQLSDSELKVRLKSADTLLTESLAQFIDLYGDRAPEELKLETSTFRSQPHTLLQLLSQEKSGQILSSNEKKMKSSRKLNILCRYLKKKALIGIAYRESSRLNRTRIYGMVRQIFRDIGQDLVKKQIIDQVEDVFFLTKEEIFNLENLENPSSLIATRKEKLVDDQAIILARRLVFNEKIVEKRASQTQYFKQNSSSDLHGIGCSKGLVRGRVLVVDSLQDLSDVRGKILITKITDPGWVYALMQAKGVIAEQGSLLSHTAIISRELGIPSIVNVPNVTKILQSGQHIEMDGRSGLIRRLTDD